MDVITVTWIGLIFQIIVPILTLAFVIYQNRILKQQVSSQKELLNNLNQYTQIIDVGKLKEYTEAREQYFKDRYEIDKLKFDAQVKELEQKLTAQGNSIDQISGNSFDFYYELANRYFGLIVIIYTPDEWDEHIKNTFPLGGSFLLKLFSDNREAYIKKNTEYRNSIMHRFTDINSRITQIDYPKK